MPNVTTSLSILLAASVAACAGDTTGPDARGLEAEPVPVAADELAVLEVALADVLERVLPALGAPEGIAPLRAGVTGVAAAAGRNDPAVFSQRLDSARRVLDRVNRSSGPELSAELDVVRLAIEHAARLSRTQAPADLR
jgi:hypothetical protein